MTVLLVSALPASADTAGRPDDPVPDEAYYDVEGPAYDEDKSGGAQMTASLEAEALTAVAGESSTTSVSFPYTLYNWTINTWYSTNDGLRFFGVYYKGEQVLYDYRTPWVWVNGVTRALTTPNLIQGPDLLVYYGSHSFQVKAKYNLGNPNIDVTVSTRFYESGAVEPWVLVVAASGTYNIGVGQRFDFDLDGASDDNQQYYDGTQWRMPTWETGILDASFGADPNGYQWRTFDTDASGQSFFYDQMVWVKPYGPDASAWYMLRYNAGQLSGSPSGYSNGQQINSYIPGVPDPWVGYDAVNWYVSSYTGVQVAYPGPWLTVVV